jgi:hypothetical protein
MNLKHIRDRISGGFKPFVIETSAGSRFGVPHPEFIAIGKTVVVVLGPDDSSAKIDAQHITALHDLPARKQKRR